VPAEPPGHEGGRPITIAVDAMGGDHAPAEIVAGAVAAAAASRVDVVLTGRASHLRALLAAHTAPPVRRGRAGPPVPGPPAAGSAAPGGRPAPDRIRIAAAEDSLAMDEGALASWRRPRSSVAVACQLVRRGQADAVVSAGPTGGIVATARLRLRSQAGVLRPGLAVVLPTEPRPTLLVDAGAIADPKPEMLLQFAQLGVAYAQVACGIEEPRVGLLTIGEEPAKGNKLIRRAHELLAGAPPHGAMPIRFVGNVEGGDLLAGKADVIVTDGFTGNVALKTIEGSLAYATGQFRGALRGSASARFGAAFQRRALRELSGRMDSETYGGAALLGLEGTVVIAHGAATARGITSACGLAADLARGQITEKIRERFGYARAGHFLRRSQLSRQPPAAPGALFAGRGVPGRPVS
jgi:glycerol-3-phosphate acyltransferase PlsX